MQLVNNTRYNTKTVRQILSRAYALVVKHEGPLPRWNRTKITLVHGHRHMGEECTGWAYINGTVARLCCSRDRQSVRNLFNTAWHEIMHLKGYGHKQFSHYPPKEVTDAAIAGLPEFIEETAIVPKIITLDDRRLTKFQKLEKQITSWEAKERRAKKALAKLRESKKYYEKLLPKAAIEK